MLLGQPWVHEAKVIENWGRKEFIFGTPPVCVSWDPKLAGPRQYHPQYDSGTCSRDDVRWIECLTGVTEEDVFGSDVLKSGPCREVLGGPSPTNSCFSVTITEVKPEEFEEEPEQSVKWGVPSLTRVPPSLVTEAELVLASTQSATMEHSTLADTTPPHILGAITRGGSLTHTHALGFHG